MAYIPEIKSLADISRVQADKRPGDTALVFQGRETSYRTLDRRASQVANGLDAEGLKPQDRLAYLGANSDVFFELALGSAKAGTVLVPINWRLAAPEIGYILADSGARLLFVEPGFQELAQAAAAEAPARARIVPIGGGGAAYEAWRDGRSDQDPMRRVDPEDPVMQMYTSGTTGRPKGALLTDRGFIAIRALEEENDKLEWNQWGADDVSLVAMPTFHIGGTGWGVSGLYNGAKNVVMPIFDPTRLLDYLAEHRISKLFMVPAAMRVVIQDARVHEVDFSALKYMVYGASPIPQDLLAECMKIFACGFVQIYGLTETTGIVSYLPPEDHRPDAGRRLRSAGIPFRGVEVSIRDAAGAAVETGTVSEICTKSPAVMAGYHNLPEASAACFTEDGFFRTGDAGYRDEDGYIYIYDRVKDMIVTGGENVYPAEVESALYGHPGVRDVAVIGVPSEKWGEEVKAIVVAEPGENAGEAAILAWARDRIAGFKCPKSIDFVDALPRNPTGKLLKRELRRPYWEGQARQVG